MTDLISYALAKMGAHDPAKGLGERFGIGLKNLSRTEATRVLTLLKRMQDKRDRPNIPEVADEFGDLM